MADIDLISVDWGLAVLGGLQLVVAVAVMYALHPIGRKPLLFFGEPCAPPSPPSNVCLVDGNPMVFYLGSVGMRGE